MLVNQEWSVRESCELCEVNWCFWIWSKLVDIKKWSTLLVLVFMLSLSCFWSMIVWDLCWQSFKYINFACQLLGLHVQHPRTRFIALEHLLQNYSLGFTNIIKIVTIFQNSTLEPSRVPLQQFVISSGQSASKVVPPLWQFACSHVCI